MLEIFIVDHAAAYCSTPLRLQHLPICLPTFGFLSLLFQTAKWLQIELRAWAILSFSEQRPPGPKRKTTQPFG